MRKYKISLFLIATVLSAIISFSSNKSLSIEVRDLGKETQNKLIVKCDKRIELLMIVYSIVEIEKEPQALHLSPFQAKAISYFEKMKEHECVKLTQELLKTGIWLPDLFNLILYHSQPPEMLKYHEYCFFPGREISVQISEKYINSLKEFYKESNFDKFWMENKETFETSAYRISLLVKDQGIFETLENFYGLKMQEYNLIPSLLMPFFAGFNLTQHWRSATFMVFSPYFVLKDSPSRALRQALAGLSFHEFSHAFVDPIALNYYKEIHERNWLFQYLKEDIERQRYATWDSCIIEHIVRAIEIQEMYENEGGIS